MQFLDVSGAVVATNTVTFVAPRVDEPTQTVLVKSLLKECLRRFACSGTSACALSGPDTPGLSAPVVAVTRLSGQHFAFIAEPKDGGFVARQRPIKVGDIVGDDYIVLGGIKPGERLIVSGIQKLGDGVPGQARSVAPMFVDTFIRRPILASVCSLVIILAGAVAIPTMPVAQYPALAPPSVSVTAIYTGANAQAVETAVTTPLEQAINGVEGMLYMTSSSTNSGVSTINVTFDVTRDTDIAAVDVQNRVNRALGRLPLEVRTTGSPFRRL